MSVGAGVIGGGAGGDESETGLLSTSQVQDALPSAGPLPHHLLPPPAAGG